MPLCNMYRVYVLQLETSVAYLQAAARVPMLMSCTLKLPVIISDNSFALPKLLPSDFAFCMKCFKILNTKLNNL